VKIRRGDFIVADKDGVIVIPQEMTLEVLQRSEELVSTENHVRKAILQGVHPVDAYQKYEKF
jgi:4-hydroxy-4-methyl-2-oxoglutarate aldolase